MERNTSRIDFQLSKWVSGINKRDREGNTPLHFCVELGEMELLVKLVANGGDLYQRNNKGESPLHLAVSKNNTEVLNIVAKQVADSLKERSEYWDYWRSLGKGWVIYSAFINAIAAAIFLF